MEDLPRFFIDPTLCGAGIYGPRRGIYGAGEIDGGTRMGRMGSDAVCGMSGLDSFSYSLRMGAYGVHSTECGNVEL